MSLADALERRDTARHLLATGADPGRVRNEKARLERMAAANTSEQVTREWHTMMLGKWQPGTARDILYHFELGVFPLICQLPVTEAQSCEVIDAIRAVGRCVRLKSQADLLQMVQGIQVRDALWAQPASA